MHFVDKTKVPAPKKLLEHNEKWLAKWQNYLETIAKNPKTVAPKPDGRKWRHPEVLKPLVKLFHYNCGYCGRYTMNKEAKKESYDGEVEHYKPKGEKYFPELTFDWDNYLWSCRACNGKKLGYYDEDCMLLNPCELSDMKLLVYNPDSGAYQLKKEVKYEDVHKRRMKITGEKTQINNSAIRQQRQKEVAELKRFLDFMYKYDKKKGLKKRYKRKTIESLDQSSFKLLKRYIIEQKIKNCPDFPYTLEDFGFK